jgi:Imm-5 like putative immunity protein
MIKAPKPNDNKLWRDSYYHKLFGYKAAKEAERVLKFFEREKPEDKRPREAIEAILQWSEDKRILGMKEVRRLSLDAHAAAKEVKSEAAKFAAHAAGQAIGSWHVPTHALGAFSYAGKATIAGGKMISYKKTLSHNEKMRQMLTRSV